MSRHERSLPHPIGVIPDDTPPSRRDEQLRTDGGEQATPEDSDIEWRCPYCSATASTEQEIRDHITDSTDESHVFRFGEAPTDNIYAYDEEGEIVDVIEAELTRGAAEVRHQATIKQQVVNAWIAGFPEADADLIKKVVEGSDQYLEAIVRKLERDAFENDELEELRDRQLQHELGLELRNHWEAEQDELTDDDRSRRELIRSVRSFFEPDRSPPTGIANRIDVAITSVLTPSTSEYEAMADSEENENLVDYDIADAVAAVIIAAYEAAPSAPAERIATILGTPIDATRELYAALRDEAVGTALREEATNPDLMQEILVQFIEAGLTDEVVIDPEKLPCTIRKRILNLYLVDPDISYDIAAEVCGCSDEYARRTLKELKEGSFDDGTVEEDRDEDLQTILAVALERKQAKRDRDPSKEWSDVRRRLEENPEYPTGRGGVVNLWLLDPTIHYTDLADVLGVSSETARREKRRLEDGAYTDDEIQELVVPEWQAELRSMLVERGLIEHEDQVALTSVEIPEGREEGVPIDIDLGGRVLGLPEGIEQSDIEVPVESGESVIEWLEAKRGFPAKRAAIACLFLSARELGEEYHYEAIAELIGANAEHVRRTLRALERGEYDNELGVLAIPALQEELLEKAIETGLFDRDIIENHPNIDVFVDRDKPAAEAPMETELTRGGERGRTTDVPAEVPSDAGISPIETASDPSATTFDRLDILSKSIVPSDRTWEEVEAEDSRVVPTSVLREIRDHLDVIRRDAEFQVEEGVDSQAGRLFAAEEAISLLERAIENSRPIDELLESHEESDSADENAGEE